MLRPGAYAAESIWYLFVARPNAYVGTFAHRHAMTRYQFSTPELCSLVLAAIAASTDAISVSIAITASTFGLAWTFGSFSSSCGALPNTR